MGTVINAKICPVDRLISHTPFSISCLWQCDKGKAHLNRNNLFPYQSALNSHIFFLRSGQASVLNALGGQDQSVVKSFQQ